MSITQYSYHHYFNQLELIAVNLRLVCKELFPID